MTIRPRDYIMLCSKQRYRYLRNLVMALKAKTADVDGMNDDEVRGQLRKARQLIEKLLNAKSDQHKGIQTDGPTSKKK